MAAADPTGAARPLADATLSADGLAPVPVTLPLRWPNRAGGPDRVRVSIDFGHPQPVDQAEALYLNFLLDGGRVTLNGHRIASIDETDGQRFVRWKRSRLIVLEPGILVAGSNRLELDLPVPTSGTTVHVPRPEIGPRALLERRAWWRDFWLTTVPVVTVVGSLFVSFGALTIWALRRSEVLFGLFGLVTLMWGLRSVTFVAESIPAEWWALWRFYFQAMSAGASAALALFALRFAGVARPALERTILVACAIGPLVTLASGGALDAAVTRWWTPVLVATLAVAVAGMARAVHVQRSLPAWSVLVAMALCLVMGVHDYAIYSTDWIDRLWPAWAEQRFLLLHYATNLMMLMIALTLVHRFVTTLRDFEHLSTTLEHRVAEREHELSANYARLAELQRERAAFEERERIMQDLHDGLGSRLFTALSRVERGAIEPTGVAQILRDCIAEMRLALDAQAFDERDGRGALDHFMSRWEVALRDAGVEATWRIAVPDDALRLPAHATLDLLRVLQEALTNALKHSGARHVSVALSSEGDELLVAIEDDGRGMPVGVAQFQVGAGAGRGLGGMRRRAQRLGARLEIDSAPGRTRVALRFAHPSRIHAIPRANADAGRYGPGLASAAPETGAHEGRPRWVQDEGPGGQAPMPAESARAQGFAAPTSARAAPLAFALLLVALLFLISGPVAHGAAQAEPPGTQRIAEAWRAEDPSAPRRVTLPDELESDADQAIVRARYHADVDLGAAPHRQALYLSGVIGRVRVSLNGAPLHDEIADPLPDAPRGLGRLRFFDLPEGLTRPGWNRIEIELAGRGGASLSVWRVGDRDTLAALRDRKAFTMVVGPALVATVIGCLGASMLALYLRSRAEPMVGYFGGGALLWSAHTFWTVAPLRLLPGAHQVVWWTTLYAALVVLLVLFCLRFGQRARRDVERALLAAVALTPVLLYAASAMGVLAAASDAVRLALVMLVFVALGVVAHHAWHRRRLDSALLVLAGIAGAGFGLRDWLVFRSGEDNLPVQLTPYAGLPFIVLVSAILIERFVRASEKLTRLNRELDDHLARREAELADRHARVAALERAQAATDERQRLMRELHDGLGAKLVNAQQRVESAALDRVGVARTLRACVDDMRLAIEALGPEGADLPALLGSFRFRWEALLRDAGVQLRWNVSLPEAASAIAPYAALAILRVMQEAFDNVLRHADARTVTVEITGHGRTLALSIEDDGRGIAPDDSGTGRGIADMRGRADALGARLALVTPPGGGTRVELQLELPD